MLRICLLLAVPGCGHASINGWQEVALGRSVDVCGDAKSCTLTLHAAPAEVLPQDSKVAVLVLAPSVLLRVHADARGLPADTWAQQLNALVAFNAGFYGPQKQHIGLLKKDGAWVQAQMNHDWYGHLLSEPMPTCDQATHTSENVEANVDANLHANTGCAASRIVDVQHEGDGALAHYAQAMQSMVLFDAQGTLRCRISAQTASRTVVATDAQGALYVVVTQGGWTLANLAQWLQATFPQLTLALNLDGGHEAQLAVQADGQAYTFAGERGSRISWTPRRRALPFIWALVGNATPSTELVGTHLSKRAGASP